MTDQLTYTTLNTPEPGSNWVTQLIQWSLTALALTTLLAGLAWGWRVLTPETVRWELQGEFVHQDQADVMAVLARVQNNYWQLPLAEIEQELVALPWIQSVQLTRHWPDQVRVLIVEQTPLAIWNDAAFINSRGEVFAARDDRFALPRLAGPDNSAESVMFNYLRLNQMMHNLGYRVQALTLTERGSWTLTLDEGLTIHLGQRDLLQRGRRVAQVLAYIESASERSNIAALDARYRHGVAVTWKSGDTL
jgi:cell division protein FtsQ